MTLSPHVYNIYKFCYISWLSHRKDIFLLPKAIFSTLFSYIHAKTNWQVKFYFYIK